MKIANRLYCLVFLMVQITEIIAQDGGSRLSADVSAELVSRYVWRGMNLSSSPAVQPSLILNHSNLSLGSWASYSFSPELLQEVDLFLTYDTKYVSFTINDYYNPVDTLGAAGDYFQLGGASTRHTIEGLIMLNGPGRLPVSLVAGIMFYGNDKGEEGNNLYSTYIELNYSTTMKEIELMPFIGITPAVGYYGEKFGIVNIGVQAVKNINLTDQFQIPAKAVFAVNPQQEKVYFVFSITL